MAEAKIPHWDLSNVYPGLDSKEFQADFDKLKANLDKLENYEKEHGIGKLDAPRPTRAPRERRSTASSSF